ncbi:MAG: SdpA family antimicrobial peptide system protein [Deltaproteobacteria bacterium]|nr:SdpA family antimicrobial peptide system protein [Deltaproteobacteria bacterium]
MVSRPRRFALLFMTLVSFSALLALYAIDASNPVTAFRLPLQQKRFTKLLFPQGWAFFTRSPHEALHSFFTREADGGWTSANLPPLAHYSNAFGFIRAPRQQGVESAFLIQAVGEEQWVECRGEPTDCLGQAQLVGTITSESGHPTLCGEVGVVQQMPVPYAWVRGRSLEHYNGLKRPMRVARLEVQCSRS